MPSAPWNLYLLNELLAPVSGQSRSPHMQRDGHKPVVEPQPVFLQTFLISCLGTPIVRTAPNLSALYLTLQRPGECAGVVLNSTIVFFLRMELTYVRFFLGRGGGLETSSTSAIICTEVYLKLLCNWEHGRLDWKHRSSNYRLTSIDHRPCLGS